MRTLAVAVALVAFTACKTDKKETPAAQAGSGSAAVAKPTTGSAAAGSASTDVPMGAALTLPKSDGSPPKKTTATLDKVAFERLAKLEVAGFEKSVRNTEGNFDVRFVTPRPRLATTVTIAPCFDCTPIELDRWKAKETTLKSLLLPELRDLPDTIWEMGKTEVNGEPVIFTYQFAHYNVKDDMGNPEGGFSNAYALYWNDGKNQIRVVAEYKDDPSTREDMLKIAPREDLERLARAYLDMFTHAWAG